MIARVIVRHQHKRGCRVVGVAHAVVVHGLVTATVAERQHRHFAYLLRYLEHFVGLQVLDNQFVRTEHILFLGHGVVHTRGFALISRTERNIHSDYSVGLNVQAAYQCAAEETVGTRDYVVGEVVVLQIVEHLQHRFVETLGVGHAGETVDRCGCVGEHIIVKRSECHSRVGLGCGVGVNHVEMVRQGRTVAYKGADLLARLFHICRGRVGCVIQCAVFQEIVFEVGRVEFADEGSIHVKRGNTVFHGNEVGRLRIGHILYIGLQCGKCLAGVPKREILFLGLILTEICTPAK